MKYLGKFTGKLYSLEEKQSGLILECALQLSDDEAENEEYLSERIAQNLIDCLICTSSNIGAQGCPFSEELMRKSNEIMKEVQTNDTH